MSDFQLGQAIADAVNQAAPAVAQLVGDGKSVVVPVVVVVVVTGQVRIDREWEWKKES